MENVKKLNELSRTEKRYLAGVHRRQGATVLPKFPSNADFEQLRMAYSKSSCNVGFDYSSGITGGQCMEQLALLNHE